MTGLGPPTQSAPRTSRDLSGPLSRILSLQGPSKAGRTHAQEGAVSTVAGLPARRTAGQPHSRCQKQPCMHGCEPKGAGWGPALWPAGDGCRGREDPFCPRVQPGLFTAKQRNGSCSPSLRGQQGTPAKLSAAVTADDRTEPLWLSAWTRVTLPLHPS